jgi:hypothetical protein
LGILCLGFCRIYAGDADDAGRASGTRDAAAAAADIASAAAGTAVAGSATHTATRTPTSRDH